MVASASAYDAADPVKTLTNCSWYVAACAAAAWYSLACAPNNDAMAVDTSSAPAASGVVDSSAARFPPRTTSAIWAISVAADCSMSGAKTRKDIVIPPVPSRTSHHGPNAGDKRADRKKKTPTFSLSCGKGTPACAAVAPRSGTKGRIVRCCPRSLREPSYQTNY